MKLTIGSEELSLNPKITQQIEVVGEYEKRDRSLVAVGLCIFLVFFICFILTHGFSNSEGGSTRIHELDQERRT